MWVYAAIHGASANPLVPRSAPLFFSSRCAIPSLSLSPPLLGYTATAPVFFLFFLFLRLQSLHSRATTTSSTPRDEVIRGYVSEVSILLASHGTGKNRDRIDRNLKRSSGMHYMTGRTGSFMDI